MKDSEWIADLVRHGLIAKSYVPPRPLRELRELLRYRRKLVESQAAERNRLLKLLETANIKLASVASDVFGVSSRAMLRALRSAWPSCIGRANSRRSGSWIRPMRRSAISRAPVWRRSAVCVRPVSNSLAFSCVMAVTTIGRRGH